MACIPSLTLQQLEILRLAKKHSEEIILLCCEVPIINSSEPPTGHPPFIQTLIDEHLIRVQV